MRVPRKLVAILPMGSKAVRVRERGEPAVMEVGSVERRSWVALMDLVMRLGAEVMEVELASERTAVKE